MYFINLKESNIPDFPSPNSDCWLDTDSENEEMDAGIEDDLAEEQDYS